MEARNSKIPTIPSYEPTIAFAAQPELLSRVYAVHVSLRRNISIQGCTRQIHVRNVRDDNLPNCDLLIARTSDIKQSVDHPRRNAVLVKATARRCRSVSRSPGLCSISARALRPLYIKLEARIKLEYRDI